ncbi:HAD family hydrolase [Streptomyces sp. YS-B37]|uniref:HAD family hydrolase n=1 Tax=Streptomyces sp. YS-B37 TaxID=3407669 RepID=UPI003B50B7C0
MTPDTAQTDDRTGSLRELITPARVVLWDFDGPICRLFAVLKAEQVARDLMTWLTEQGLHGLLTQSERQSLDPHVILRSIDARRPDSDLVTELEKRLTMEELKASASAMPTPYADPLIRTWQAVGSRLAITTNNSPRAVREYLESRGLTSCFSPHIYGRTRDLQLLKPDPHCLNRALKAMGTAPSSALMIGDSVTDYDAACEAGVPFLGYASDAEPLLRAGAKTVVDSFDQLLKVVRSG